MFWSSVDAAKVFATVLVPLAAVAHTFLDDFGVFWVAGGGGALRDNFLGSSCGGRPAGARKVVFGVVLDGFGLRLGSPRDRFAVIFGEVFPVFFWLRSWELFWMDFGLFFGGFGSHVGVIFPAPWILRFVWPLLYQTHILGGQIC